MKTTKEMIEVMTAYENGAVIEATPIYSCGKKEWKDVNTTHWNWKKYHYRIKEQKKTITIEKWLVFNGTRYNEIVTSNIDDLISTYTGWNKVKLLDTYEVGL